MVAGLVDEATAIPQGWRLRRVGSMMRKGSFPPSRPPTAEEHVTGAVSWFSASKGFGFIKPVDGSEDVFVHVSVVQRAGRDGLRQRATVTCEVAPGKKGRQVTRLLDVNDNTATAPQSTDHDVGGGFRPRPARPFGSGGYGAARAPPGRWPGGGFGKWFDPNKGFGFVPPYSVGTTH